MERKLDFNKYDKYGQKLTPGNVCVRLVRDGYSRSVEFCVYKQDVTGNKSKGTYGRFITPNGISSIKYSNVIFVFDTVSKRTGRTEEIVRMTKEFYEGVR